MRSKQSPRCIRCRMHEVACICKWMPQFDLQTRVLLVMHYRERGKSSATGPMALNCLSNSERRIYGLREKPLILDDLFETNRRLLCLYPQNGALRISPALIASDPRPVTLVVPDGSWRQATRMRRRIQAFTRMEMVQLPLGEPSSWQLRKESHVDRVSTFEAIARCLGVLESSSVQASLEQFFARIVETSLKFRTAYRLQTEGSDSL